MPCRAASNLWACNSATAPHASTTRFVVAVPRPTGHSATAATGGRLALQKGVGDEDEVDEQHHAEAEAPADELLLDRKERLLGPLSPFFAHPPLFSHPL